MRLKYENKGQFLSPQKWLENMHRSAEFVSFDAGIYVLRLTQLEALVQNGSLYLAEARSNPTMITSRI